MFYTAGMLLQQIFHNPMLQGISHVIIDEVHERSVAADLILILLRRLLSTTDLKIILMSASTDTEQLQEYFGEDKTALIKVPGTLHPLEQHFLPKVFQTLSLVPEKYDWDGSKNVNKQLVANIDLIVDVIRAIDVSRPPGAILCFLTGWQDIQQARRKLSKEHETENGLWILPLHSHLSSEDQVTSVIISDCFHCHLHL